VVRIDLRSGRVLRLTREHPVMTVRGWTAAGDICAGDFLAAARMTKVEAAGLLSEGDGALLGYLIGDGCVRSVQVEITNTDAGILDDVREQAGRHGWWLPLVRQGITYRLSRRNGDGWRGVESPSHWCRCFDIVKRSYDKRVPTDVFTASDATISRFIGAYFACDGHVTRQRNKGLEFSSTSRGLLEDVQLLLLRFGIMSRVRYHHDRGAHTAWRLLVTGAENLLAFRRCIVVKGDKGRQLQELEVTDRISTQMDKVPAEWRLMFHRPLTAGDASQYQMEVRECSGNHRTVVRRLLADEPDAVVERLCSDAVVWDEVMDVAEEEPEMTYALPVHDMAHCYLSSGVISHNSQQMAIGRVLWELGRDPNSRTLVLSNTKDQARKIVETLKRYIERDADLHAIFPALEKGDTWTSSAITVRRPTRAKDPSVQACGVHGNVTGSRVDLLIIDDILDPENTGSQRAREDLWLWLKATIHGRLTENARVIVIGTAYHPEDALHLYAKQENFHAVRFPVLDDTGASRWPERWSLERIEKKKVDLGSLEFARQMLCVARDDTTARFKAEWIERCKWRGQGKELCYALESIPNGYKVVTGVDLAVQKHDAADQTCLFTIAVAPNGDRHVLNIETGKWHGPEIVDHLYDHHRRYQGLIIVENNSAQDFVVQFARERGALPIRGFTTGRNKAHPEFGVESLAAEMEGGKWVIPNINGTCHPEVTAWINELLYYSPSAHTGDRVMASWFAREGVRMGAQKVEQRSINLARR